MLGALAFSRQHFARMSETERQACLAHELAHVAYGDTWFSPLPILLTDMDWFVPHARAVLGRILSLLELRADSAAVRAGAAPEALASTLITTGDLLHAPQAVAVGLQRRGLLARRVRRLLEPSSEPEARVCGARRCAGWARSSSSARCCSPCYLGTTASVERTGARCGAFREDQLLAWEEHMGDSRRGARWRLGMACVSLALSACGGARPAQHLKFSEASRVGGRLDFGRPFVLEFEPGDRLPIHLQFSDQLFELQPPKPGLVLVAKRHGFVLVDGERIVSSLRGDDFDARPDQPGRFRFGLAITRQGSWIEASVATPRHAEPSGPPALAPAPVGAKP